MRLLSHHFWQRKRFAHRFRSSRSLFAWLVQKKEITTNSLWWPRSIHQKKKAKNSASERFMSLTDNVIRFVEAEANKNAQRKMHSNVVLMKSFLPNVNETRKLQDIPPPELDAYLSRFLLSLRKKSGEEYLSQQHSEELSLLWSITCET